MGEAVATAPAVLTPAERTALTRRALRLAQATVAWNVVEGVVAVAAGLAAGLVSVVGFGLDSGIETAAAVLVTLRLAARLRRGALDADADADATVAEERRERVTLRLVALTFVALAAWVTVAGVRALVAGEAPEGSRVGLVLLAVSLVVMPALAAVKARVGRRLGDPLVLADAAETRLCALLSASTLAGLGLYELTGATWLDPVAGFVIAAFALHEAREAWEGELVEDHDGDDDEAEDEAEAEAGSEHAARGAAR